MSNMVVLHNPSAGKSTILGEALARMARRHSCDLRSPQEPSEIAALVQSVAQEGVARIIVAGGDGTISRVANALLPKFREIELAVVPIGTGNDLARSLDLPLDDVEMSFDLAATRPATPMDVVQVHQGRDLYFVNAATAGFGGEVTASLSAANKQLWGPFAYWLTAMARLVDRHAFDLGLTLDGERSQQPVYGIAIANGRYVGGGFPIAGKACLNDGLIDVTTIPELPTLELLSVGLNFVLGDGGAITTKRAKRVEVHALPELPFSLDGEAIRTYDAVFEVVPAALRIVPGDNPEGLAPKDVA